jgi:probable F420-dependent oxidoreductase
LENNVTDRVEFGVRLPVAGPLAGRENIAKAAQGAEKLGFDALWVHDHIMWNRDQDTLHISVGSKEAVDEALKSPDYTPNFYESITTLSFVSGLTERIKIGTAVLCPPFRNPIVTAKQIATLDQLSNGRLILGVGVGAPRLTHNEDFELLGVPRGDKYRRTTEYLNIMKTIWTEERPSYDGRYVSFAPTDINPKPLQKPHPPLWIAGRGEKGMLLAAKFGNGWLPGGLSPEQYPERINALKELAAQHGRPDAQYTVAMEVRACVDKTTEEARRQAYATEIAGVGSYTVYSSIEDVYKSDLVGSTEAIRERVGRYVEGGVRHFELKPIYHNINHLLDQLARWSEEITPAFR